MGTQPNDGASEQTIRSVCSRDERGHIISACSNLDTERDAKAGQHLWRSPVVDFLWELKRNVDDDKSWSMFLVGRSTATVTM